MKQTTFLRYILTQKSFSRILNRENKSRVASLTDVQVVVDHTLYTQLQRSAELKEFIDQYIST